MNPRHCMAYSTHIFLFSYHHSNPFINLFSVWAALLKTAIILAQQLLVNSLMDVNELVNMVISMAKLRHVNANAAPEVSGSATDDLNDGNRIHEHDAEITLSDEYDYRTDAVCALPEDSIQRSCCCTP